MKEYMGKTNIIETDIWMASEDFAYYAQNFSSCFYLLGTGYPKMTNPALHTSGLEINEECLETSMGLMSYLAMMNMDDSLTVCLDWNTQGTLKNGTIVLFRQTRFIWII